MYANVLVALAKWVIIFPSKYIKFLRLGVQKVHNSILYETWFLPVILVPLIPNTTIDKRNNDSRSKDVESQCSCF